MFVKEVIKRFIPREWLIKIRSLSAPKCYRGKNVYIAPNVQFIGASNISIGDNSCVSERTWFNVNRRLEGLLEIVIETNCFIGRDNFFSSGNSIKVGHYTLTTIGCKFICSSHIIENPSIPFIVSGTTSSDSIRIGVNCFFGAGSMVIGNVSIGHGSIIGAGAQITKDVPPFSIVVGVPGVVVKRYSFSRKSWLANGELLDEPSLDQPDEASYLELLRVGYPSILMPIIASNSMFGNY